MSTASPPVYSTRERRAYSDTAIRARIFSTALRTSGAMALSSRREDARLACQVPTIGPSETHTDSRPRVGPTGSWTCRMSRSESLTQRRARAVATGPKLILATDPFELMEIGLPPLVT